MHHLGPDELEMAFREFRPFLGKCRFANCRHLKEPGCAIHEAVASGAIATRRLDYYQQLRGEIS